MNENQYTWGDTVRIAQGAPPECRPGSLASICGMRTIPSLIHSHEGYDVHSQGQLVYLVEFGDGYTIEIIAEHLDRVDDNKPDE